MTLRQLEYLVAVIDEGSFGRAALALHVSQPTLSSQVRALEDELGGPLLERLPRGVRATPTGEAMLPAARASLAAAARARRAARMVLGLEAGELEIATVGAVALGLLPPVMRRWRARHPEVWDKLEPADVLVDAMRGRNTTWTRIRLNLRHVPEEERPPQEPLEVDYDPWAGVEWPPDERGPGGAIGTG